MTTCEYYIQWRSDQVTSRSHAISGILCRQLDAGVTGILGSKVSVHFEGVAHSDVGDFHLLIEEYWNAGVSKNVGLYPGAFLTVHYLCDSSER